MALITAKNLSLGYDSHIIVKDLNFSLNGGDYLCIVGENGSGKKGCNAMEYGQSNQV